MISYYGQVHSCISPILYQLKSYLSIHIGIINWWSTVGELNLSKMEEFVNGVDICFVVSEERLAGLHNLEQAQSCLNMLDQDKVHFILFAEEPIMPNSDRCFNYPWFTKSMGAYPHLKNHWQNPTWDYIDKQYTFNMLLGSERAHRTYLFNECAGNINIYSTYFGHNKLKAHSNTHLEDKEILNNLQNQNVDSRKLNTLEEVSQKPISHIIPENIYNHSHFDIVSETTINNEIYFASEKTAKPLATGRWFISYVTHKHFEYLEKWGFDFSDYQIDYDVKENTYRLDLIVKKIKEINENTNLVKHIYSETKANRIHNAHVYYGLVENIYKELTTFICNAVSLQEPERTKVLEEMDHYFN